MRLLTWNVNGLGTVMKYHPWNETGNHEGMLNLLGADICCFQEHKTPRKKLTQSMACCSVASSSKSTPSPWDAFFSFPLSDTGYSGVCVYSNSNKAVPVKVEEGITGRLYEGVGAEKGRQTKLVQLKTEDRVEPDAYPLYSDLEVPSTSLFDVDDDLPIPPPTAGPTPFESLDSEGRGLTLDFGLFVLINVYCPNLTNEERMGFKMDFMHALEGRVRRLMAKGREVILVGDLNVVHQLIDHGEGTLESKKKEFWQQPHRRWFDQFLEPKGPMIDLTRKYHPDREGMFTCWNMKISARAGNYGTRLDYILATPGLLPWIKTSDIDNTVKGSDHCPVWVDFYDELNSIKITDLIKPPAPLSLSSNSRSAALPPPLATRYYEEYSGKQTSIQSFFVAKSLEVSVPGDSAESGTVAVKKKVAAPSQPEVIDVDADDVEMTPGPSTTIKKVKKEKKSGQQTLNSFFVAPLPPPPASKLTKSKSSSTFSTASSTKRAKPDYSDPPSSESKKRFKDTPFETPSHSSSCNKSLPLDADIIDVDELASAEQQPSQLSPPPLSSTLRVVSSSDSTAKATWNSILAEREVPRCKVHGLPCKEFEVKKPGLNKGKMFWLCNQPVGPGYDSGKGTRLREEVDPRYRCNFFIWSKDVPKKNNTT